MPALVVFLSCLSVWPAQPQEGQRLLEAREAQNGVAGSGPICQMAGTRTSEGPRCLPLLCPCPGRLSVTDPPQQPRCGGFFSVGSGAGGLQPPQGGGEQMPHCWLCHRWRLVWSHL